MLKFDDKKVVGKAIVEVEVTENDVETIMVTGIEGGINYWATLVRDEENWASKPSDEPASTWATMLLLEGKTVQFRDSVEEEDTIWLLTLETLIKGFAQNAKERPFDCNLEQGDATTSDCIIQYAIFQELVYG